MLAVQVCFGFFPLFGKWAFESFTPHAVAAWRIGGGAALLLALAWAVHGRAVLPHKKDLVRLQLCSLLGVAANQLLFLEGLARSNSTNAGLLVATIPVITLAIAAALGIERLYGSRLLGLAIALAGKALLLLASDADVSGAGSDPFVGNLLMLANVVCYSIYLVATRDLVRKYPPLVVTAWAFALSVPAIVFFAWGADMWPADASERARWSLAWVLAFPTVLAYLLNLFALARLGPATVASLIFLQPLLAGFAGVFFLDEALTVELVVAGVAILLGLVLVVRPPRSQAGEGAGSGRGTGTTEKRGGVTK